MISDNYILASNMYRLEQLLELSNAADKLYKLHVSLNEGSGTLCSVMPVVQVPIPFYFRALNNDSTIDYCNLSLANCLLMSHFKFTISFHRNCNYFPNVVPHLSFWPEHLK